MKRSALCNVTSYDDADDDKQKMKRRRVERREYVYVDCEKSHKGGHVILHYVGGKHEIPVPCHRYTECRPDEDGAMVKQYFDYTDTVDVTVKSNPKGLIHSEFGSDIAFLSMNPLRLGDAFEIDDCLGIHTLRNDVPVVVRVSRSYSQCRVFTHYEIIGDRIVRIDKTTILSSMVSYPDEPMSIKMDWQEGRYSIKKLLARFGKMVHNHHERNHNDVRWAKLMPDEPGEDSTYFESMCKEFEEVFPLLLSVHQLTFAPLQLLFQTGSIAFAGVYLKLKMCHEMGIILRHQMSSFEHLASGTVRALPSPPSPPHPEVVSGRSTPTTTNIRSVSSMQVSLCGTRDSAMRSSSSLIRTSSPQEEAIHVHRYVRVPSRGALIQCSHGADDNPKERRLLRMMDYSSMFPSAALALCKASPTPGMRVHGAVVRLLMDEKRRLPPGVRRNAAKLAANAIGYGDLKHKSYHLFPRGDDVLVNITAEAKRQMEWLAELMPPDSVVFACVDSFMVLLNEEEWDGIQKKVREAEKSSDYLLNIENVYEAAMFFDQNCYVTKNARTGEYNYKGKMFTSVTVPGIVRDICKRLARYLMAHGVPMVTDGDMGSSSSSSSNSNVGRVVGFASGMTAAMGHILNMKLSEDIELCDVWRSTKVKNQDERSYQVCLSNGHWIDVRAGGTTRTVANVIATVEAYTSSIKQLFHHAIRHEGADAML